MNDTSPMPFGKHKNKLMQDVPCDYLNFLWNNGMKSDKRPVAQYIRDNLNALKQENTDLIWDKDETRTKKIQPPF